LDDYVAQNSEIFVEKMRMPRAHGRHNCPFYTSKKSNSGVESQPAKESALSETAASSSGCDNAPRSAGQVVDVSNDDNDDKQDKEPLNTPTNALFAAFPMSHDEKQTISTAATSLGTLSLFPFA
jgi:hypothetical protein